MVAVIVIDEEIGLHALSHSVGPYVERFGSQIAPAGMTSLWVPLMVKVAVVLGETVIRAVAAATLAETAPPPTTSLLAAPRAPGG